MEKNNDSLKVIVLAILVGPFHLMFKSFVLMKAYLWLIAGQFNVSAITYSQAIGLTLFIGLLTHNLKKKREESLSFKDAVTIYVASFVYLALSLAIFYGISRFL